MRIARKLPLLAMLAVAAMALAAPPAFAQVEPELHDQAPRLIVVQEVHTATDIACPAVTPSPPPASSPTITAGGCRQHYAASNFTWVFHLAAGGTEVWDSTCDVEFDVRLDSAGEGWISHQELTPGTVGTCERRACGQVAPPTSEGRAWTVHLQETEAVGQGPREDVVMLICTAATDSPSVGVHCELTIPVTQPTTHHYRWAAVDASGHGATFPHCERTGTFDQEATLGTTGEGQAEQNVEVRHT